MARVLLLLVGFGGLAWCAALVVSGTATAAPMATRIDMDSTHPAQVGDTTNDGPYERPVLTLPIIAAAVGETGTSSVLAAEYAAWWARQPRRRVGHWSGVTWRPRWGGCGTPALGRIQPHLVGVGVPTGFRGPTNVQPKMPRKREGTAKIGSLRVSGHCAKLDIARVLRSRLGAFRNCYQAVLDRNAKLRGRLALQLTIDPAGRALSSTISRSTIRDPQVGRCVLGVARRLRFPKPELGTCHVQWTLDLSPRRTR